MINNMERRKNEENPVFFIIHGLLDLSKYIKNIENKNK